MPVGIWSVVALGTPNLRDGLTRGPGMLIEGMATFFLVLILFALSAAGRTAIRGFAGAVIGLGRHYRRVFCPAVYRRIDQSGARVWTGAGLAALDESRRVLDWSAGWRHYWARGFTKPAACAAALQALSRPRTTGAP